MPYKVSNEKLTLREQAYLPEMIRGLGVTARHFLRNLFTRRDPAPEILDREGPCQITTVQYPEEKVEYPPGYRGLHRLVPREDGSPRCVACYMCATVCPAQCIYIEAGEYPAGDPSAPNRVIERYPTKFVIDELRCIVCGFCVEACPKDAIRMDTGLHAVSSEERSQFVLEREALLRGPAVEHPSDPWRKREDSSAPDHGEKEAHTRISPRKNGE
ncbi:MAG TPA: NADH-quinone oxidoreductase subunit I [Myxococcales bacterium]|nr:NADH-quinone oxidoreductase subunit I [Myxococcales bacterium]